MTYFPSVLKSVRPLASGAFRYFLRLASADPEAWKYLPYQLSMNWRGIDLSGASQKECGLSEERSYGHRDSGGPDLDAVLRTLSISESDAMLDFGCGKAGAMLTMAKYPFVRVDGVELSSQLALIGQDNLRRLRISNATVFCRDAAEFTELDLYTYFYMYNPFPELVLRSVLNNVVSSLGRRRRKVTLIYKNPFFHELIVGSGFRSVAETRRNGLHHQFAIYMWDVAQPMSSVHRSNA